jgi:hypothetical protein
VPASLSDCDFFCQVEHVLRNFHVLDFVKVFLLAADFVGIPEERSHQTLVERLKGDDVLPAREYPRPIATMFMLRIVSRMTANASCPTFPSGTK